MSDDKKAQQDSSAPLPKFQFLVRLADGNAAKFQEMSGSDNEGLRVDYRHGNSPSFYPIKMPGLHKVGDVTLRRGVVAAGTDLWKWLNEIKTNTLKRRAVAIDLLDEAGAPKMVWTLNNAWPRKFTGPDLNAEGNEIAIESLELAYETLTIAAP
jgi:phage tail-like protein